MKESIINKWVDELENGDVVDLEFIISGLSKDYYKNNLDDALEFAIENFVNRYKLSRRTEKEMYNIILVRDAFYKMLEREGLL